MGKFKFELPKIKIDEDVVLNTLLVGVAALKFVLDARKEKKDREILETRVVDKVMEKLTTKE